MFRSADDSTIAMGPYSEDIVVFIMHLGLLHFLTMIIIWALGRSRNGNGRKRKDILDIFE